MSLRAYQQQEGRSLRISSYSRRQPQMSLVSPRLTAHAPVPRPPNRRHPRLPHQTKEKKSGRPASSDAPHGPTGKPPPSAEERVLSRSNASKREIPTRSSLHTMEIRC